jgi:hypothetical protein
MDARRLAAEHPEEFGTHLKRSISVDLKQSPIREGLQGVDARTETSPLPILL